MRYPWLLLALVTLSCAAPRYGARREERDRKANEILMWYGRILDGRMQIDLPADVNATPEPPTCSDRVACDDVCDIARHICAAKDEICRIAGEMGDDAWARDKCASARSSCKQANGRCSACRACKTATLGGCGPPSSSPSLSSQRAE